MRYAGIDSCDLCNGNNIGMSLYVQGCNAHCKNCFNPETWDFNGGKEWTDKEEASFLKSVDREYIKRVTFLGGEPLAKPNIKTILYLSQKIKSLYPSKEIWVYTGYEMSDLYKNLNFNELYNLLNTIDYLVDGRYIDELHDNTLPFRGSKNQKIWKRDNSDWKDVSYNYNGSD